MLRASEDSGHVKIGVRAKMEKEGEGKQGNACRQTPQF